MLLNSLFFLLKDFGAKVGQEQKSCGREIEIDLIFSIN